MPVEMTVSLRGDPPAGSFLSLQRGAHGSFFKLLSELDVTRAAEIHASGVNPFTQALLKGEGANEYIWRLTFLQDELAEKSLRLFRDLATVSLFSADFSVVPDTFSLRQQQYAEISALKPAQCFSIRFITPVSFKHNLIHQPLPDVQLMFRSWWNRWHHFAPVEMGINISLLDLIQAHVAISSFSLRSTLLEDKRRRIVACQGWLNLVAVKPHLVDDDWWRQITALAAFGHYAGVGVKTAQGMGQLTIEIQPS